MRPLFLLWMGWILGYAQTPCKSCHVCETPTATQPCLVDCPREDFVSIRTSVVSAPVRIVMDQIKGRYGALIFSHRAHAEMADMVGGCASCHHHNTSGPILQCRTCHPIRDNDRKELGMPGLEAALHRQCISCHREWDPDTRCQSCHGATRKKTAGVHAAIVRPTRKLYSTTHRSGPVVTFDHAQHAGPFGFSCTDCHAEQSCTACHRASKSVQPVRVDRHSDCFSCHAEKPCESCHRVSEIPVFDHGRRTGWPLQTYHQAVDCRQCHGEKKQFAKVATDCNACHRLADRGSFRHQVTGLKLDENHNALDCGDCHSGKQFHKPPTCDTCHDDKRWPADTPGVSRK